MHILSLKCKKMPAWQGGLTSHIASQAFLLYDY